MKRKTIQEHFSEVETTKEYKGYSYSIGEALTLVILGSICGLRNVSQIHQWAGNDRVREFLKKHFKIKEIPCYYWLLCLLKMIKPESLNRCFIKWVQTLITDEGSELTLCFDGKTICSTAAMDRYKSPLHIVSAHIAEMGLTLGQQTVSGKSNEIPAMRELLEILELEGCMVVADALHCQKETAKAVIGKQADYLLSVKDNQPALKESIADFVQDDDLRKTMDTVTVTQKNRGRVERRCAYSLCAVEWLHGRQDWEKLACIGAIHSHVSAKGTVSEEWHYYISSRSLTAKQLLHFARMEWSVESMHWLLDVHFGEDFCRVEDETIQQNLNMVRKAALNTMRHFKNQTGNKRAFSKMMLDCLLEPSNILPLLQT